VGDTFACYAVATPGLEALLAEELRQLGPRPGKMELGGVSFQASPEELYAANLHLRVATRVLVRVAEFHAAAFSGLERQARRVAWERFVPAGGTAHFRVSTGESRLYHQEAVAQRLEQALEARVPNARAVRRPGEADALERDPRQLPGAQRFVVRLFHDRCTISVDSSGALLHRRGYRLETAKAPLRETLAAAMLRASGWDGRTPLLDPMCGSGTIPIEAALLARRMPPGLNRRFAFERWPELESAVWRELVERARERALAVRGDTGSILASDRDPGAIEAARANAERADVAENIEFRRCSISAIEPPAETGWMVTNPPYGARMGDRLRLRNLYAQLGNVVRRRCPGWRVALLSADRMLEGQTGLELTERFRTSNGGIRVRLMVGNVGPS